MSDFDFNYHSGTGDTYIGLTANDGPVTHPGAGGGAPGAAKNPVPDIALRAQSRCHDSRRERGLDERHVRYLSGRRVGVLFRDPQSTP